MCGVTITVLRNFPKANASSLVLRAPPSPATVVPTIDPSRSATRSSASVHDASRRLPSCLIMGDVSRCGEFTYSKVKRSLSDSQPWFVGSLSTPLIRTTSFWLDWRDTFDPTLSTSDTLSTASRSHGLARKRYGLAVSAPTGHISTVLPEKYDAKGSSGNVSTWVTVPRSANSMRGSPGHL